MLTSVNHISALTWVWVEPAPLSISKVAISLKWCWTARLSGVQPSLSCALMLAPCDNNTVATVTLLCITLKCKAVRFYNSSADKLDIVVRGNHILPYWLRHELVVLQLLYDYVSMLSTAAFDLLCPCKGNWLLSVITAEQLQTYALLWPKSTVSYFPNLNRS